MNFGQQCMCNTQRKLYKEGWTLIVENKNNNRYPMMQFKDKHERFFTVWADDMTFMYTKGYGFHLNDIQFLIKCGEELREELYWNRPKGLRGIKPE